MRAAGWAAARAAAARAAGAAAEPREAWKVIEPSRAEREVGSRCFCPCT